ncbi:MAG: DNA-processing protein DprA [Actinomycetia bacterium]|nr:DNA-processing protein DprA [Actinomycetes bacterium]
MTIQDQAPSVRPIQPGTSGWPTQLNDLGMDAPRELWCSDAGDLRLLALRSVAIVGCRAASAYGRAMATELAAGLASAGWVVVSGAAFGIDAAAHRGALSVDGPTIAVLPGGIDQATPRAHTELLETIRRNGLLVSEHGFGVAPHRHMFLTRNRIIAALVRAVVVVEADYRSGALNTARIGERLGRNVLAVPGPATSRQSNGTHELLRTRRAELVTSSAEVAQFLSPIGENLAVRDDALSFPLSGSRVSNPSAGTELTLSGPTKPPD